jgi:hypothetical protein
LSKVCFLPDSNQELFFLSKSQKPGSWPNIDPHRTIVAMSQLNWLSNALLFLGNLLRLPLILIAIAAFWHFLPYQAYTIVSSEVVCRVLDPPEADHGVGGLTSLCEWTTGWHVYT